MRGSSKKNHSDQGGDDEKLLYSFGSLAGTGVVTSCRTSHRISHRPEQRWRRCRRSDPAATFKFGWNGVCRKRATWRYRRNRPSRQREPAEVSGRNHSLHRGRIPRARHRQCGGHWHVYAKPQLRPTISEERGVGKEWVSKEKTR